MSIGNLNGVRVWLACALLVPGFVLAAQPEAGGQATPENREQRLADARQRLEQAAREVAELSLDESGRRDVFRFRNFEPGRAALGVNIGRAEQGEGVPVLSVSPGGPAANAGIKAGDLLLSVGGKALQPDNGRSSQTVLLDFMEGVDAGETVAVEYRRDGKTARVDVVAEPLRPQMIAGTAVTRALPPGMGPFEIATPGVSFFRDPASFGAMELVTLTPKLGQYFGADKGLLVVRAPADSRFGLEDGDVIIDIAGRMPTSPAHAMRILDSYQPGEKLTLTVLRQKKRVPVGVEIPADALRGDLQIQQFRQAIPALPATPGVGGDILFNGPAQAAPLIRALPAPDDRV